MEKIKVPASAVIDFAGMPKLAAAVEARINAENEKGLTPKYMSTAQFIIELLEKAVK